jgi:four helix bundle protein
MNSPVIMFDFQKLEVYKKAKRFHTDCLSFLKSDSFHRSTEDQLTRASFSVALNIAEGAGRYSRADRRNFFVIARASIYECVAIIDILKDNTVIPDNVLLPLLQAADELSRMLFAMIKNLSNKQPN